jgi:23S rRNA (cytidine2498-2'-O)-methyltransferase
VSYSFHLHRRAELIQGELPHVSAKPLEFPARPPSSPLGSWTLLDAEHVLASPACSSPFPNGVPRFVEPLEGPPNLAYLKLWEALTLLGRHPAPGERCLDAGSAPGGWTWALARLGARVLSVDRAPLAPAVAQLTGVEHRQGNAFQVRPQGFRTLRLDLFRRRLLSRATLDVGRRVARRGQSRSFRLHTEVPG